MQGSPLAPLQDRWRGHPATPIVEESALSRSSLTLAVADTIRPAWLAALPDISGRPVLAVLPAAADVEQTAADIAAFGPAPCVLDAWETLPYEHVSPGIETMGRRVETLRSLASGVPPPVTLLAVRALLQRVAPNVAGLAAIQISAGATLDLEELERSLARLGYERTYMVEARGEFAVRGGILDIFPATSAQPLRVEFWGDQVDTIRRFSIADQRSIESIEGVAIGAARELVPDEALRGRARSAAKAHPNIAEPLERISDGEFFAGMESFLPWILDSATLDTDAMRDEQSGAGTAQGSVLDFVPDDCIVVLCDPKRCLDRANDLRREEEDLAEALARTWQMPHAGLLEAIADHDDDQVVRETQTGETAAVSAGAPLGAEPGVSEQTPGAEPELPPRLFLPAEDVLADWNGSVWQLPLAADGPDTARVSAGSVEMNVGRPEVLAESLSQLVTRGMTVIVAAEGAGSQNRIRSQLVDEGLSLRALDGGLGSDTGESAIVVAALGRGFVSDDLGLAVVAEADLTGRRRTHRRAAATRHRKTDQAQATYGDLRAGDFVVHYQHGVGRFEGIASRSLGGVEREYLDISYAKQDKLYVPVDQAETVRKYVGGDTPRLSRMGGSDWARAKSKVRSAVSEIADELVQLYRERMTTAGHAFEADAEIERRLAESFMYDATPDQVRAIGEVAADMEAGAPMDRVICGDVGFGKTEIAVRAALKATAGGRQVGVLAPTTVLAQQHFQTFGERYADLPVRVEMLSRFLTTAHQRRVIDDTAAGKVDVLIGTHRMLQPDVTIPNLGLLVVDEEQRFGVKAKERLKTLRASIDVLTMTATPIPRTLEFALSGIRDMSVVNTPPEDRRAVLTYVGEFDEQSIAAAIRRELLRDGQVFYVHNRVQSIDLVAKQIGRLVPEARIAVAHGQMDDASLERIMLDFWDAKIDVLCATTIIESGLDIARANTLIVDRADLLGLAQLYQLRGRVGRARERAYAYLFYPPNRELSEEAHERLKVIAEHQDLGSGFAIAMRDLELRGAGNLLGAAQTGHIAAVGFDLYCQMVSEAVAELKGEAVKAPQPVRVDLPVEALIPDTYMPRESLRLEAYRRLGDATSAEQIDDVRDEWVDRYGSLPVQAENLLEIAVVKAAALRADVNEVVFSRDSVRIAPCVPTGSRRMRLERLYDGLVIKEDLRQVVVPYRGPEHSGRGAGSPAEVPGRAVCNWTVKVLEEISE